MDARDFQVAKEFEERAYQMLKPMDNRFNEAEEFKHRALSAFEVPRMPHHIQ